MNFSGYFPNSIKMCFLSSLERNLTADWKLTRKIHSVKEEKFGLLGQPDLQFDTWRDAFFKIFQNILEDGIAANVKLPYGYDYYYNLLDATIPCLERNLTADWKLFPSINCIIVNGLSQYFKSSK